MPERRRSRRFLSLNDRLALYANEVRETAALLPPGVEKEALLKKARQADRVSELEKTAGSSDLPSSR